MEDAQYFQQQAQRCYRLARGCFDLSVVDQLNALGDEFSEKAHKLDADGGVPSK